jgi:putative transposase
MKRGRQLSLVLGPKPRKRRHGVRLGRRPQPERAGYVPHVARPVHDERHPVHVSIKRTPSAPSLRAQRVFAAIAREIALAVERGVRVLHHSVQHDHLHLMVEAEDRVKLARGLQQLFSRIAFAVNRVAERSGSLFRDRHHRRALATPTEVRRALVYVLFNARKHDSSSASGIDAQLDWLDPCSSAMWFTDWDPRARPPPETVARVRRGIVSSPLSAPRTWLARAGWKRGGGLIRFNESPAPPPR